MMSFLVNKLKNVSKQKMVFSSSSFVVVVVAVDAVVVAVDAVVVVVVAPTECSPVERAIFQAFLLPSIFPHR